MAVAIKPQYVYMRPHKALEDLVPFVTWLNRSPEEEFVRFSLSISHGRRPAAQRLISQLFTVEVKYWNA